MYLVGSLGSLLRFRSGLSAKGCSDPSCYWEMAEPLGGGASGEEVRSFDLCPCENAGTPALPTHPKLSCDIWGHCGPKAPSLTRLLKGLKHLGQRSTLSVHPHPPCWPPAPSYEFLRICLSLHLLSHCERTQITDVHGCVWLHVHSQD